MAVTCRHIWLRRNKLVFYQIFTHPTAVLEEAVRSLEDFRLCNSTEGKESIHNGGSVAQSLPVRWQAPHVARLKSIGMLPLIGKRITQELELLLWIVVVIF
jgi:hypothetical protein